MGQIGTYCKREWPTFLVIALAFGAQLYLVTRSIPTLIQTLIPDDAFFSFQLARNILEGLGSSLDGIHSSNGYHPLWTLLLVLVYKLFPGAWPQETALHAGMILPPIFVTLMVLVLSRVFTRFAENPWIRAFGMGILLLNPFFLYGTVNGLETPLALCLFSLFFLLALRIEEGRPIGEYALIGLVGGMMFLARLDMAFYLVAFALWLLIQKGFWSALRPGVVFSLFAGLSIIPWIVWNWVEFGMFLQTSASAGEAMWSHAVTIQDRGTNLLLFLKDTVFYTQRGLDTYFFALTGIYALGSAFLGALVYMLVRGDIAIPKRLREIPVALMLFGGAAVYFFVDASIRWGWREWHYVPFNIFLAIGIIMAMRELIKRATYPRMTGAALAALVLFSFAVNWSINFQPGKTHYAWQTGLLAASEWMNENLPEGSRVATYTPGIQAYFSRMRIVDLDGLINNSAYEAMRENRLWAYTKEEADYVNIYERDYAFSHKSFQGSDPYQDLELVADIPKSGGVFIYRIKK